MHADVFPQRCATNVGEQTITEFNPAGARAGEISLLHDCISALSGVGLDIKKLFDGE